MEPIKIEIFNKYLEIKKDLVDNLTELELRQSYYTKKYRGNLLTDINVGIFDAINGKDLEFQIFVRHGGFFIKENTIYNLKGLFSTTIKNNLYE